MNNYKLVWIAFVLAGVSFLGGVLAAPKGEPTKVELANNKAVFKSHVMPDGSVMMNSSGMAGGKPEGTHMESMMREMMQNLDGKSGDDFDRAFVSDMIVHHQGAVKMAEAALKSSKNPELLGLARSIIKAQAEEIDLMKGWQKAWSKK